MSRTIKLFRVKCGFINFNKKSVKYNGHPAVDANSHPCVV